MVEDILWELQREHLYAQAFADISMVVSDTFGAVVSKRTHHSQQALNIIEK